MRGQHQQWQLAGARRKSAKMTRARVRAMGKHQSFEARLRESPRSLSSRSPLRPARTHRRRFHQGYGREPTLMGMAVNEPLAIKIVRLFFAATGHSHVRAAALQSNNVAALNL